jgi:hypothetical protein
LSDSHGHVLAIDPARQVNGVNPADNYGVSLRSGSGALGFAWDGSWCEPRPTAVQVILEQRAGRMGGPTLTVPLRGPSLGCTAGDHSTLVAGVVGGFDSPLQSAPASWRGLRISFPTPPHNGAKVTAGIRVRISNVSAHPITLAPCPTYTLTIQSKGGHEAEGFTDALPCPVQPLAVAAHRSTTLTLPDRRFDIGVPATARRPAARLSFAIAGVPTATTRVTGP